MKIITDQEIRLLPLIDLPTEVILCNQADQLDSLLDEFKKAKFIGFDTEKRPNFKKGSNNPISLVQISTTKKTLLIQIQKTGYNPRLWDILTNPNISKIGVALKDDFKDLSQIYPLEPAGVINLDAIAKKKGLPRTGLRFLAGQFLQVRISKKVQTSNWANSELTQAQIKYAAIDAWVCLEIYTKLLELEPE